MPQPNRVNPEGEILPLAWRGQFMGNRGILHKDRSGTLGTARWRHPHWVTCTLALRPGGQPHPIAAPGRYTALFFPDEAVACAAGHRPCVLCRRAVWQDFAAAWGRAFGQVPRAPEVDQILHAARRPSLRGRPTLPAADLPFGAFFHHQGRALLRLDAGCRAFDPVTGGYDAPEPLPEPAVSLLTPLPMVRVMAAGWRPLLAARDDRPSWPAPGR